MSLDGLRAWIGVVERKLTMRTRVFLVLAAIAIGGAAAGIVLAIDAQDNAVSKDDLQSVRDELAGSAAPAEAAETAELKAQIEALQSEVAELRAGSAPQSEGSSPQDEGSTPQGEPKQIVPKGTK
ncbi:MAG TPA: hypothetical protein VG898_00655 [Solirubrobacterales bacterium]|nr:hypothetical protein [Solirubrobacterales bacterium]